MQQPGMFIAVSIESYLDAPEMQQPRMFIAVSIKSYLHAPETHVVHLITL